MHSVRLCIEVPDLIGVVTLDMLPGSDRRQRHKKRSLAREYNTARPV